MSLSRRTCSTKLAATPMVWMASDGTGIWTGRWISFPGGHKPRRGNATTVPSDRVRS